MKSLRTFLAVTLAVLLSRLRSRPQIRSRHGAHFNELQRATTRILQGSRPMENRAAG